MSYSRKTLAAFVILAAALSVISGCSGAGETTPPPPLTAVIPVVDTLHGVAIEDPYRWLEDQESPETRAWIDAQNEYTRSFFSRFPNYEKVKTRLGELMRIDDISMPLEFNGRYFLYKKAADQEQYVIAMREGLNGEDRVLLDPHTMDSTHNTSVNIFEVSRDGALLAYGIRHGGEDEVEVHFLNVDSGVELKDVLPKGQYFGMSIDLAKKGFYYVAADTEGGRLRYHRFGDDFANDKVLFGGEYTASDMVYAGLSEDRKYLVIGVYYGSTGIQSDVYIKSVMTDGPIVPVVVDKPAFSYVQIADDKVYVQTNYEAPNWRVLKGDVTKPGLKNLRELIPEDENNVIQQAALIAGKLYVSRLENVSSNVKIYEPDGTFIKELELPAIGTVGALSGGWEGNETFLEFSSYHIPSTIYRIDAITDEMEVFQAPNVPINSQDIKVDLVWYASKDGTQIPMFLVHKKDVTLDGNNPTVLTGYGGFTVSRTPEFRMVNAYWVEAGGVLAAPCLRGGGEFGEEWHRAAMLEKKQNTFDDFIAAAEWLIANKYTKPEKLAIRGGSNGGLLVGAFMNQRPDLCKAVICSYPLLDMLRFHKFLAGPYWVGEYGSADNPEQFEYIYRYSPYHNVKKGVKYPSVLYVTGDGDTRVAPLHARKMTALMQDVNGANAPVLLLYDTQAGHSLGTSVSTDLEENAAQLGYLFWQLGATP